MPYKHILILSMLALGASPALVFAQGGSNSSAQQAPKAVHAARPPQGDGERVFQQNCSRCHTAPDGFSPRIANAVTRHMRIRASLSRQDMEALLRFFNP